MTPEALRFAVAACLGGLGALLLFGGAMGALRLGDVYQRMHAIRAAAAGAPLVLAAAAIELWSLADAVGLALVAAALAAPGPALAHLIAHAAHRDGVQPEAQPAKGAQ